MKSIMYKRRRFSSLITYKVHPVLSKPVEALQEEQESEQGYKARGEVIPEHSKGQARLCHRIPGPLNEMLVDVTENKNEQ